LEAYGAAAPPWWLTGHRAGNFIPHRRRWMFIFFGPPFVLRFRV